MRLNPWSWHLSPPCFRHIKVFYDFLWAFSYVFFLVVFLSLTYHSLLPNIILLYRKCDNLTEIDFDPTFERLFYFLIVFFFNDIRSLLTKTCTSPHAQSGNGTVTTSRGGWAPSLSLYRVTVLP
jgi:hypothetical protein